MQSDQGPAVQNIFRKTITAVPTFFCTSSRQQQVFSQDRHLCCIMNQIKRFDRWCIFVGEKSLQIRAYDNYRFCLCTEDEDEWFSIVNWPLSYFFSFYRFCQTIILSLNPRHFLWKPGGIFQDPVLNPTNSCL